MFLSSYLFLQALGAINFLTSNSYTVTRDQRGITHSYRRTEALRTKIGQILLRVALLLFLWSRAVQMVERGPHVARRLLLCGPWGYPFIPQSMCWCLLFKKENGLPCPRKIYLKKCLLSKSKWRHWQLFPGFRSAFPTKKESNCAGRNSSIKTEQHVVFCAESLPLKKHLCERKENSDIRVEIVIFFRMYKTLLHSWLRFSVFGLVVRRL
jgi:hypothetical protein